MNSDDFFKKLVAMLFGIEGGYVNDPNDSDRRIMALLRILLMIGEK